MRLSFVLIIRHLRPSPSCFCDLERLPCTLNDGLVDHLAAQRNRALALFLADADGLEHKPRGVVNIALRDGLNTSLIAAHVARCRSQDLPVKPRLFAYRASRTMPSSSLTSVNGVS